MVKSCIINTELSAALAQARHKDVVVICDANMPVPRGCKMIDVSLMRGVPTMIQTLKGILNDFVAERYQVFNLMPRYNPETYETIQSLLPQLPGGMISQEELSRAMVSAAAVVRTGDMGSCCTVVLHSASGMDKYVSQFNCQFQEGEL